MVARPRISRATAASAQATERARRRPTVEGLGDEVGAAELSRRVAESLKRHRAERGLSLDQLALSSGVSRAALSQIEGARTNPTIGLVWKVAIGLGIPFQALLGGDESQKSLILRAGDAIPLRSTDGRMESRLLSPAGSGDRLEVYELRFQAKGFHRSESHGAGASETVILLSGSLRVTTGEETHDLNAGDTLYFLAHLPHSYENRGARESRCIDIIAYGRG
ncbi:MAG TPA: XRE family transcriptional regulator [Polyangiaceae bacterium]|jgi:transcriptional regulator with XRE-family HTH domain|nr:XRE family transcriptional regulator [Polyangiaceae bacterium]